MKALFWIIAIVALAAGLVAAARYNAGYLLLVLPPYRIELSLNLFALVLFLAFAFSYFLVRMVSGTMRLPAQVREYRVARRRQKAQATLLAALHEFFAGRYARAEKAAASSIELGEHAALCAVLAARAAHELRAFERRDAYLAQAAALAPDGDAVRIVTEAELLLDQRRFQEALDVLKSLPRRHTAALRLELKAQQLARNWEQVLALVDQLEKRNVFDAEQANQIRRHAQAENLKRKALDSRALEEAWQKIPKRQKRDTQVAAAAAQCFIALGDCARAQQIIEESIEENWDSQLIGLYAECAGGDMLKRIERAEAWLKRHPHDAALLLTLGRLCALQELWGKAQSYLEASISIEPAYAAHLALAQLHKKLGDADAARRHYRESLELTVAQLKQIAGERRRTLS
ncbi:MAG: heme biosynthesis protein HemY [Betaproteobacteria bacterium RIFCSPLOWO2_12_FULL_62_13]|nr:MAG: heme biosynthesis protein HemY [Betaproteobacteria bacterium RIFCSPLOWO2_12_FULL_62_13]